MTKPVPTPFCRRVTNRRRREREFAEELESHLAMRIEDNLRAGMSPEEARRRLTSPKLIGLKLLAESASPPKSPLL